MKTRIAAIAAVVFWLAGCASSYSLSSVNPLPSHFRNAFDNRFFELDTDETSQAGIVESALVRVDGRATGRRDVAPGDRLLTFNLYGGNGRAPVQQTYRMTVAPCTQYIVRPTSDTAPRMVVVRANRTPGCDPAAELEKAKIAASWRESQSAVTISGERIVDAASRGVS